MMSLIRFFKDSWQEMKLVTWLTRAQMVASTWLVIFLVFVFTVFVFFVDKGIQILFRRMLS
jgi:preprotein translocase SecE subunit